MIRLARGGSIVMVRAMKVYAAFMFAALLGACASSRTEAPSIASGPTTVSSSSGGVATTTPAVTVAPPAPSTPAPATAAPAEGFSRVTVAELAGLLDQHAAVAIFDNNARPRYELGHVPGARWVAYDGVTADVLPNDRNTRLVFYCANEH